MNSEQGFHNFVRSSKTGTLVFRAVLIVAFLLSRDTPLKAQNAIPTGQAEAENAPPAFTLTAVTRLVIVDVVVRDSEDNPVRDLTANDLRVTETINGSQELPESIASFQPVDGAVASPSIESKGIVLSWLHKSFCPLSGAYELSYYLSADSRKDGLHRIQVTTSRKNLTLYFRPGYRINADQSAEMKANEVSDTRTSAQVRKQKAFEQGEEQHPELELPLIACYDTLNLTDFQFQLRKVDSKKGDSLEFVVPGSYFASLPDSARGNPRQFDFSLCTFAYTGQPLRHFEGNVQLQDPATDLSLLSAGFTRTLNFEGLQPYFNSSTPPKNFPPPELSARLVLRDHTTGALGTSEVLLLPLSRDLFAEPVPENQTNQIFGTKTVTTPLAMCGDVYQLAPWTTNLPRFSEIDATAPIYATSLSVYSRFFTQGIPGVTGRDEWFGVNYQGSFGIDKPGNYEFRLFSDDGAKVYIDDRLIVSDDTIHPIQHSRGKVELQPGAHNIRISYFQGPRTEVALVLLIKPPGRGWRLFDTRDFPPSNDPSGQRQKLPLTTN